MAFPAAEMTETLRQCACETLENLAFTEIEPLPEASLILEPAACVGARISLGAVGSLDMILEKNFLGEIGGILFNLGPEELDPSNLQDTLSEILNIIAGRFLESMHQGRADFTMGLPTQHLNVGEWNALPVRWVFANEGNAALAIGLSAANGE